MELNINELIKDYLEENKKKWKSYKTIDIDLEELKEDCPELRGEIINKPEETIKSIENIFDRLFAQKRKVLIHNDKDYYEIHKLNKNHLDKLISIKGMCKRRAEPYVRVIEISFKCESCGTLISLVQDTKKKNIPKRCSCGGKRFEKESETNIDAEELWIEDMPESGNPSQIHVYLEGDLIRGIESGKRVSIVGILRKPQKFMTLNDEILNTTTFYLHANNFHLLDEEESLDLTDEEIQEIEEIAAVDPLDKLSKSFMNHINGQGHIKKAVLLQAVGPSRNKFVRNKNHNLHMLLVGDVGTAKTEMLNGCMDICPGARFSVGSKSSKVGLTSTVTRDEVSGLWSLEAGALPLANNSILCIDELDKMPQDTHEQILTPMSSGVLNINKASFQNVSLECQTGVLASANPTAGNFDRAKPLAQQVQIITPLLNRFDLIFLILDIRLEEQDAENARAFMKRQRGEYAEPEVPFKFIKKYINYARKIHVDEKSYMNDMDIINFYTNLRAKSPEASNMPVNLRSLGAVNSLATAHARLCLRSELKDEDYIIAFELFMKSVELAISPITGQLDTSMMTQKMPFSRRGKMEEFLNMLTDLSEEFKDGIPYKEIFDKCKEVGIKKWEITSFIEALKKETRIFEPSSGKYKVLG